MEAPQLYRESIIALRDSQWEHATRTLLALVSERPTYRDAATVLTSLEKLRPVAYWTAVFYAAADNRNWDTAASALRMLESTDPNLNALPSMKSALAALQASSKAADQITEAVEEPPSTEDDSSDLSLFEVDLSDNTTKPSTIHSVLGARSSPGDFAPVIFDDAERTPFTQVTQPVTPVARVAPPDAVQAVQIVQTSSSKAERNIRIFLIVLVLIWASLVLGGYLLVSVQSDIATSIGMLVPLAF